MSLTKTLCAAAALLALATPALAQSAASWDLHERNGHVLDMQGKMWSPPASTNGWSMTTRGTRPVPGGTLFFMNSGQPYMAKAAMFDRVGNVMAGGV